MAVPENVGAAGSGERQARRRSAGFKKSYRGRTWSEVQAGPGVRGSHGSTGEPRGTGRPPEQQPEGNGQV